MNSRTIQVGRGSKSLGSGAPFSSTTTSASVTWGGEGLAQLHRSVLISVLRRSTKLSPYSMRSRLNRMPFRASPSQSYFRTKPFTLKDSAFATLTAKRR